MAAGNRAKNPCRGWAFLCGGEKLGNSAVEEQDSGTTSDMNLLDSVFEFLEESGSTAEIAGINGDHETEETHEVEGGEQSNDAKAFWEMKHNLLRSTLFRTSPIESKIRKATQEALKEVEVTSNFCCCGRPASDVCRNCQMREVCRRLRDAGFNCSVSKSKWGRSSDLQAGEHTFLDVTLTESDDADPRTGGTGEVVVIELNFRGEFEMAKGGEEYNELIQKLPEVFVGKIHRLEGSIKILCSAVKKCMKDKNMHLGPWRKKEYMMAKWLSPCRRITPAPASDVTPLADRTNSARRRRASMLTVDLLKNFPKCNIQ